MASATTGLQSMTGFARIEASAPADLAEATHVVGWSWEARSVNAKGLDVRIKLPLGQEELEAGARQRAVEAISRGTVYLNLQLIADDRPQELRLNPGVLQQVMDTLLAIEERHPVAPARSSDVMAVKGVLEVVSRPIDPAFGDQLKALLLDDCARAVEHLTAARGQEGARLGAILNGLLDEMSGVVTTLTTMPDRARAAIEARLQATVERLLESTTAIDPGRLHQEVALAAMRADIAEEIDRLTVHLESARALLAAGSPCGRKLDFLCQEFNREANTICSKAATLEITQAGLALKALIEKLREQVQNIE